MDRHMEGRGSNCGCMNGRKNGWREEGEDGETTVEGNDSLDRRQLQTKHDLLLLKHFINGRHAAHE